MDYFSVCGIAWIAVHLMGLLFTWMVRMNRIQRYRSVAEGGYLVSLTIVALTTIIGQLSCLEIWPLSAATLTTMIVMAVIDFGGSRRSVPLGIDI